jgi:antitoxin component YwqK of YwqJK toxin-antitoxin module
VELSESKWTSDGKLIYNRKILSKDSSYYSYEAFYPNGVMKERGYLFGKSVTGRFESWHENGRRFIKATVVNDHWEDFMYIWNEQGIQVYSASVHQGIACDDEVVRSDKGIILKRGTKECKAQISKYAPYGERSTAWCGRPVYLRTVLDFREEKLSA